LSVSGVGAPHGTIRRCQALCWPYELAACIDLGDIPGRNGNQFFFLAACGCRGNLAYRIRAGPGNEESFTPAFFPPPSIETRTPSGSY